MSASPALSALYRRLRRLIGDMDADTWDDDDLQDVLESHSLRVQSLNVELTPGGGVTYYSDYGNFGSALFFTPGGQTFDPLTADMQAGKWLFENTLPSCLFLGTSYDLYGAAADLLEAELATLRRKFDTTDASGASMKRNQEFTATETLIKRYRAKQRVVSVSSVRSDVG